MGSENAHGCAQNAENGLGFDFLEQYHKYGDEFLNHIVRVTGDETWVSFVKVETKEQSKQRIYTHSPKEPKELKKRYLPARKLMATVSVDRKGVLMGIHATRTTITSQMYCETLKRNCVVPTIQNKMRRMLTHGVVLLPDNVLPHTAARIRVLLEYFNWELLTYQKTGCKITALQQ
jgi:hypothetical protein